MKQESENRCTSYCSVEETRAFLLRAMDAVGVRAEVAAVTCENLLQTSIRGTDSHGIRLLPHYIAGVQGGRINPAPDFRFERRALSCGVLDADDAFGGAAGVAAMDEAITLASEAGCGFVAVKNSSHCGALAQFALRAARRDMVGLAFTHATPKMRSENGVRPFFGTNPLCVAAPMRDEAPFCFDSAPTPFSSNKVKQYREEGRELPRGVAADGRGGETLDPELAEQLLPIGGYKGFGLSMVVDLFCGLFSGMAMGDEITTMYGNSLSEKRKLGQFFGAIDIKAFEAPSVFKERIQDLADRLRREPSSGTGMGVLVPGDPEKREEKIRLERGIPLTWKAREEFCQLAQKLGIEMIKEKYRE